MGFVLEGIVYSAANEYRIQSMAAEDIMLARPPEAHLFTDRSHTKYSKKVKRDDKLDRIFLLLNLC